jgi:hypothetical protein
MFELKIKSKEIVKIESCGDCPMNLTYPNPLLKILPPTHYCSLTVDKTIIYNPNTIPRWCPNDNL